MSYSTKTVTNFSRCDSNQCAGAPALTVQSPSSHYFCIIKPPNLTGYIPHQVRRLAISNTLFSFNRLAATSYKKTQSTPILNSVFLLSFSKISTILHFFIRTAKHMDHPIRIHYSKISYFTFFIWYRYIQPMIPVINFVDQILKHGSAQYHIERHLKIIV